MERSRRENGGMKGVFSAMFLGSRVQDSCNFRFVEELEAALKAFDPAEEDARAVIQYVLEKGLEYKDDISVSTMFTAVQQFAAPLLSYAQRSYRRELAAWYDGAFPQRVRTPVMREFRERL